MTTIVDSAPARKIRLTDVENAKTRSAVFDMITDGVPVTVAATG